MSSAERHVPKYRHYKPKNLGVVRIDGRDHYLGRFGSPESYERYHRLLAERYARGPAVPAPTPEARPQSEVLTITELCVGYYRHCERYYTKNGRTTNQVNIIKLALKVLRALYGSSLVKDFSPLALKACRAEFIGQGLSRRECNRRTRLIKQAFRWSVGEELVPPMVYHALTAVSGLASGRCDAPDPQPIGPVPEAIVERTIEHLTPTVAAMVRLQLATAMRPGEVCRMRACDINITGPIWEYRPHTHKTEHHEGIVPRIIMLGPRAQEVIRPFLGLNVSGYLFSPRQSEAERNLGRRAERKTPLWPSHVKHQAAKKRGRPGRKSTGDAWHPNAYRKAVAQACDAAFPHPTLSPIEIKDLSGPQLDRYEDLRKALRSKDLLAERRREIKASIDALLRRNLPPDRRAELEEWRKSHRWHPNQLRHSAATAIRRRYGAEAAQAVLGHAELSTTEIYAERSLEAARQIMKEIG
jgi:integrase